MSYAARTMVPAEKTQQEIVTLIKKRGASGHMIGEDSITGRSFVAFMYKTLPVRLNLPPPNRDRCKTPQAMDKERKRLWRVALIWIKSQFEVIDAELLTPYKAFFGHLQLRDGRTVADAAEADGGLKVGPSLMLPSPEDVEKKGKP